MASTHWDEGPLVQAVGPAMVPGPCMASVKASIISELSNKLQQMSGGPWSSGAPTGKPPALRHRLSDDSGLGLRGQCWPKSGPHGHRTLEFEMKSPTRRSPSPSLAQGEGRPGHPTSTPRPSSLPIFPSALGGAPPPPPPSVGVGFDPAPGSRAHSPVGLGGFQSPPPVPPDKPFAAKPLAFWSKFDVADWLDYLRLGEHKDHFLDNEIDGSHLPSLQKEDYVDLGVTRVGHRMNIERALKQLLER